MKRRSFLAALGFAPFAISPVAKANAAPAYKLKPVGSAAVDDLIVSGSIAAEKIVAGSILPNRVITCWIAPDYDPARDVIDKIRIVIGGPDFVGPEGGNEKGLPIDVGYSQGRAVWKRFSLR